MIFLPEVQAILQGPPAPLAWILALLSLFAAAATCTFYVPQSRASRWLVVVCTALIPIAYGYPGLTSVFLTGQAIVFAVRISSFTHLKKSKAWPRSSYWLWLLNPVYTGPAEADTSLKRRWSEARVVLARGVFGLLAWWAVCVLRDIILRFQPLLVEFPVGSYLIFSGILVVYFALLLDSLALLLQGVSRLLGASVEPVFLSPFQSTSVREFWGRRWNRFISRFALMRIALPLKAKPRSLQLLAVFGASGLFHEYFVFGTIHSISFVGPMSVFFLLQALVVLAEGALQRLIPKKHFLRRSAWLQNRVGHLFTLLWMVCSAPLFFLPLKSLLLELGYPAAALSPLFAVLRGLWFF